MPFPELTIPTINRDGSLMTTEQMVKYRQMKGLCPTCPDTEPTQCFRVEKNRFNPLKMKKIPLTSVGGASAVGGVYEGNCLRCFPEKHPDFRRALTMKKCFGRREILLNHASLVQPSGRRGILTNSSPMFSQREEKVEKLFGSKIGSGESLRLRKCEEMGRTRAVIEKSDEEESGSKACPSSIDKEESHGKCSGSLRMESKTVDKELDLKEQQRGVLGIVMGEEEEEEERKQSMIMTQKEDAFRRLRNIRDNDSDDFIAVNDERDGERSLIDNTEILEPTLILAPDTEEVMERSDVAFDSDIENGVDDASIRNFANDNMYGHGDDNDDVVAMQLKSVVEQVLREKISEEDNDETVIEIISESILNDEKNTMEVLEYGTGKIQELVGRNNGNCHAIMCTCCLEALFLAMFKGKSSARIQMNCCEILKLLCCSYDRGRTNDSEVSSSSRVIRMIVEAGCLPRLVDAIERHIGVEEVVAAAMGVLDIFALECGNKLIVIEEKDQRETFSTILTVSKAVEKHEGSPLIRKLGYSILDKVLL